MFGFEIPSNIIASAVGALIGGSFVALGWYVNRFRPKYVEVYTRDVVSLLSVNEGISKSVVATYNGKPVQNLSMASYYIFTRNWEITDIRLTITYAEQTEILAATYVPDDLPEPCLGVQNQLVLTIPFLNNLRHHEHYALVTVFADGDVRDVEIAGQGKSWSVKHTDPETALRGSLLKHGIVICAFAAIAILGMMVHEVTRLVSSPYLDAMAIILMGFGGIGVVGCLIYFYRTWRYLKIQFRMVEQKKAVTFTTFPGPSQVGSPMRRDHS